MYVCVYVCMYVCMYVLCMYDLYWTAHRSIGFCSQITAVVLGVLSVGCSQAALRIAGPLGHPPLAVPAHVRPRGEQIEGYPADSQQFLNHWLPWPPALVWDA